MVGFYGRILTIDLTMKQFKIESLSQDELHSGFGGKSLATRLLLERNPAGIDPLDPGNMLIFATGPFCQGSIWGGSRYGVYTKSPLTGFYSESYSGGKVPEAIDATGFDAIVITGKSDRPVVLSIEPETVEFHEAGDLWGRDIFVTERSVIERFSVQKDGYRKPGAVVIGPAGENLVRFAIIANDKWRCAGRTGTGAVLGAKQVKAVVFQGDRKRQYHQPQAVTDYFKAFSRRHMENPGVKAYRNMGTTMMVALMNTVGAFPARYWHQGTCDHWESISGETYHQQHQIKPHACAKCFMACGRLATLAQGRHKGLTIEGPEYETIFAFGGLCMVTDMAEIAYLNDICDRLGLDTITAGNLCGLTIEACRAGKIEIDIDYGDVDGIARLLEQMASRDGIGDVLANGIIAASQAWGMEDMAIHVKGLEPAGYDPRVLKGMGLAFATSPRGACHLRTTFYKPELAGLIPPDQIDGKAEMLIDYEDRINIFDSLILCRFYRDLYTWEELVTLIPLVTGIDEDKVSLRHKAANIANMVRQFNIREGFRPDDHERLPKRLLHEALPSGHALSPQDMDQLLTDYYRLRGW